MRTRIAPCLLLALAACGDTTSTVPSSLALDRPMDVAFGCFGGVRITGGGRAGMTTDTIAETAVPIADCDQFSLSYQVEPPPAPGDPNAPLLGQEDLSSGGVSSTPQVAYYSFILQSVPGTVAVATWTPKPPQKMIAGDVHVLDIDTTTPGANGLSVGDTPVGIVTDDSGCYAVTANGGTCDLSTIDITSVLKAVPDPIVQRADVTNAAGAPILARPAAIAMAPSAGTVGVMCPATPQGIAYVAYPDCHRVAAIDLSNGQAVASIVFDATGHATIDPAGGNFTCPAQCGVGDPITDGARPTTLDLVDDPRVDTVKTSVTRRLAIGAANSNVVTVVDLDANHLPVSTSEIAFQGSIGVNDVALTPQIGMGGDVGEVSDDPSNGGAEAGQFQFVYAVASDGTVRVADMLTLHKECDTEIDPRFLTGVTDPGYLACMPLGDPRNGPRRPGALGPGIQLVGEARAVGVTVVHAVPPVTDAPQGPDIWMGYFAAVTSTTGAVYVVNIDDDNYPDVDDPTKPVSRWLGLAMPHQIRDRIASRSALSETTDPNNPNQNVLVCNQAGSDPDASADVTTFVDGPHLWPTDTTPNHPIAVATSNTQINPAKIFQLPTIHQVMCLGADENVPVSELGFAAPADVRKNAFPDLMALRSDETWLLTWEGPLSNDSSVQYIDGPIIRQGQTIVDGTGLRVEEQSHPYCAMGVEPYDEVVLRGCDPNASGECGFENTCYVHPNSTTGVGSCLPTDLVDSLSDPCKEFLVSERRYAVDDVKDGALHLIPRRHVLRTTPLAGCASADQCGTLEDQTYRLAHPDNPVADIAALDPKGQFHEVTHTWACEADPSRPSLNNQCVMSCLPPGKDEMGNPKDGDLDCDDGTVCDPDTLRCVEGVVPPLQCLTTLQRYEVHAADAFTLIGSRSGYVHPIIADANGQCVRDPLANPLQIGRIPLTAPPCLGDGLEDLSPNPCTPMGGVEQAEFAPDYAARTGDPKQPDCQLDSSVGKVVTRQATAIRFRNASMTFEMVDPTYTTDKTCIGDHAGGVDLPLVFPGYALQFRIASGFLPYLLGLTDTVYPINVVRGPLESIWVVDEGDFLSAVSASTRGAVFRVESTAPAIVNTLQ